jgi:hypothetical protein
MHMHATASAEPKAAASPAPHPPTRRRPWRLLIRLSLAALLVWPLWEVGHVLFFGNVHEVIPGQLYRGAQPSGETLETLIQRYKIRTVLNVRGRCWPDKWYVDEAAVCERHGVNLEDVSFSAIHLPSRDELRILFDVLDRAEPPVFVHCRQGADRTGIASMSALLLREDQTFESAQRQLSMRYGHAPIGKTTMLDRFMKLYADWLRDTNQPHTPANYRRWVLYEYKGGWCDARIEKVERLFDTPRSGKTLQYRVVVRNTSMTAWQLRPSKTAGFHVIGKVYDETQNTLVEVRGGMLDRLVPPGETIDVVLIIPPALGLGHNRLLVDMIEEGHCWFHQTGSEPWEEEIFIRE